MTGIKDLARVAIRLFALYVAFNAAILLPNQIGMYLSVGRSDALGRMTTLSGIIFGTVYLLAGAMIWKYSARIAAIATDDIPENVQINTGFSFERNYKIAASILGLFILSQAIPNAIILVISQLFPESNPRYIKTLNLDKSMTTQIPIVDYLHAALQLAIGAWLFFGSKGLVYGLQSIWNKGKNLGT